MAIKLGQHLKQTQSLMMTPQLQQAIKLLTLTHLEMTNLISQEMVENPMLEEAGVEMTQADSDYDVQKLESQNQEATADNFTENSIVEGGKEEIDWESYVDAFNSHSSSPPSMATPNLDETPNYENIVSRGKTLAEHLEWQLRMNNFTDEEWSVAELIIHNINDDGYLEVPIDDIIEQTKHDREDTVEILSMIQHLDPSGCGARDLVECLMIQARMLEPRSPLVETLIDNYLDELQRKDYTKISKETGIAKDKIKSAEIIIHSFHPKPGRLVSADDTHYIIPDIYVKDLGGELVVQLNDDGVPRLKISKLYKSMIKAGLTSAEGGEKAKEFVEDKLRAAMWLIKSIQNRQKTILKVAEAIVKYQPEFFRKGPQFLRPMILKDIAYEIGMHESTVSRVTTNKYLHCPLGTFELKYFFNTGVGGKNGGIDIASESLKLKIKNLIENENVRKPLSDQKIAELLSRDGIKVARRTVAKYREVLNIASSSKRKRME